MIRFICRLKCGRFLGVSRRLILEIIKQDAQRAKIPSISTVSWVYANELRIDAYRSPPCHILPTLSHTFTMSNFENIHCSSLGIRNFHIMTEILKNPRYYFILLSCSICIECMRLSTTIIIVLLIAFIIILN